MTCDDFLALTRSGLDGRVLCRCTTHYGLPLPPLSPLAGSGPR
jgi:hypothetical protein